MRHSRTRAVVLAASLAGWSGFVGPRLAPRWQVPVHAALSTALVLAARTPLGLRPPALGRGLRLGVAAAGAVATGVTATTAAQAVRRGMAARDLPDPAVWLLLRIPIGTVWSEEAAFRAALGNVADDAFGPVWGRIVQSAVFGLSHVADARRAGEPVLGTVLVTGAAGWVFGWLYGRSGSLAAPMLVHLAINEAGAVAALAVQHRAR